VFFGSLLHCPSPDPEQLLYVHTADLLFPLLFFLFPFVCMTPATLLVLSSILQRFIFVLSPCIFLQRCFAAELHVYDLQLRAWPTCSCLLFLAHFSLPSPLSVEADGCPPWDCFSWRFQPVKKGFFLLLFVTYCLPKGINVCLLSLILWNSNSKSTEISFAMIWDHINTFDQIRIIPTL